MVRAALFALLALCAVFLMPQTAKAEPWPKCLEADYLHSFDPRMTPQPCEVVTAARINWRGGHKTLRVIRPTSMPAGDNSALINRVNETAAAVGAAMDKMGGLTIDDVTIMMTAYVSPREGEGEDVFRKGDIEAEAADMFAHECPVSYYKVRTPGTGNNFVFILSHELFHCIQFRSFRNLNWDDGWLIEATAEYFAYLAKAEAPPGFIPEFDAQIQSTAIPNMDYPDVVFYLWLGHAYQPTRVKQFIDETRSITAITPDMLFNFAKAYFDQTIQLPFGQRLPSNPRPGRSLAVHGATTIASPAMTPYALNTQTITFDRGKIYHLSAGTAPDDARMAWREGAGGISGDMPATITTCDGPKEFRVIRTTTQSNRAADITVTAETAGAATCQCPAGTWIETAASARHYFEQSMTGGQGETVYISGLRTLTLNADKTGSLIYNNIETRVGEPGSELWLEQTKNGGTHFTWKVVAGQLLTVLTPGNNMLTLHNLIHTHSGTRSETRQAGAQSIGHPFFCDAAGLHLRQRAPPTGTLMDAYITGYTTDMDFVRVGAAPTP